jgi:hypothetical protein
MIKKQDGVWIWVIFLTRKINKSSFAWEKKKKKKIQFNFFPQKGTYVCAFPNTNRQTIIFLLYKFRWN